jgi:hypothetical protein
MGIALFYVTVFRFFFWRGCGAGIGGFGVFLRGVLKKGRVLVWCFAGEFVVRCVADVDTRHHVARSLKTCHDFDIYFQV